MTDKNTTTSQNSNDQAAKQREDAAVALANEFLSRATLGEALSQVSLNALIQLSQNRALQQGREQVQEMSDEQVAELLQDIANTKEKAEAAAESAVEEVTNETANSSAES